MSTVRIKLEEGTVPTRGSEEAAGYDVYSKDDHYISPGHTRFLHTGVYLSIPRGMHCEIRPRSGLSTKRSLIIPNSPGTIDSDYRGEVLVALRNIGDEPQSISAGDRIAQMVFIKHEEVEFEEVDTLDDTNRGDGGFGSTGIS